MSLFGSGDREVELTYLNKIFLNLSSLRVEISKLRTEVRDLRAERKEPAVERIHYPPPAPSPEKKWWGAPWKTSLG